jgi:dihydroorotate dehydrogenase (fumarate)
MSGLGYPVKIAGIRLANPLMNGAYIRSKTLEDVKMLAASDCGAIVVGSISVKPRRANPGQNYWYHKERFFSLNSYGLPNGGIPYFKNYLPRMVETAHAAGKPLIANLIGFSSEEFGILVDLAEKSGADMAELNFGCPNVWDGGSQKRIISYHASLVKPVLAHIAKQSPKIKICVKISPLPPDILQEVAQAMADSNVVHAVTATNSYPNSYVTAGARSEDSSSEVLAGLAGRALKPISVGVVKQLREVLPRHIDIIGCGGISSANDVKDYLAAGAKAVQIATALKEEGPSTFEKVLFQA